MGKNQAYKAMQRSRLGTSSSGPEEIEDGMVTSVLSPLYLEWCLTTMDAYLAVAVDGSFHSPEWHAARLASLNKSHTVTWEEFKKKQKEDEMRKGELEADKDRMMREYRAQLDAERAHKLAHGRNHSGSNSIHKKDRKDRDLKKRGSKKRKLLMENTLCDSEAIERNTEMDHPSHKMVYFSGGLSGIDFRWVGFQELGHHLRRRSDDSSSSSSSSDSSSSEDERELKRSKSRSRKTKKEKKRKSRTKHSSGDDEEAGGPVPLSRFFGSLKN
ncbi:hypothetical protein DKX38_026426 [Salix brachista]|uniref:Uncharacterized protein n=1 Tax=Salix brachista TaxID=2182728 RepID=A0A5N5J9F5_9ROSI|nr:hypothetical protein DKX38_026426 [Salix brachista]